MMFAVAIGEVGIQTASLVKASNWVHFLPAYSHLLLATIVIATSWVGWTLSPSPGAREDVTSVFGREFLVLLLDVFLVVVYFILVKSVDITEGEPLQLHASAKPEALWIAVIFGTYLIWDFMTKVADYVKKRKELSLRQWSEEYGVRIVPTICCFAFALWMKPYFDAADAPHVLTVDLALVCLVLLFRSLKILAGSHAERKWAVTWSILLVIGLSVSTVWTVYSLRLPTSVVERIQTTPIE